MMATVGVFEPNGFKRGKAVPGVQFVQVLWDPDKKEYTVPLPGPITGRDGLWSPVSTAVGGAGTIQASAADHLSNRFTLYNGPGYFEVWLSHV
jgi:hypothetical protein